MGLGKTLTTLALIVHSLEASSRFRPTLIVTPLSREYPRVMEKRVDIEM